MFDFIPVILGHLVGDYVVQNDWMALNKKKAWKPLLVHCFLYTLSVELFCIPQLSKISLNANLIFILGIFLSHIVIDGTDIVDKWAKLIGARTLGKAKLVLPEMINLLVKETKCFLN